MKLGKPINKLDDLKQEDFINKKALIHFNLKKVKDAKELEGILGIKPPQGKYMNTQILVFNNRLIEHDSILNTNPKDASAFYIGSEDSDGLNIDLIFKQPADSTSKDLIMIKLNIWIHEDLIAKRLRYKVMPLLEETGNEELFWDTIFCEADIPDF